MVAGFFLGFEFVERLWLQELSPESLHWLHLARGISAAAIAATLAATLLLRQLHESPARPTADGAWRRGVQRVRLRTKIVVPVVALAVAPALAIGIFAVVRARAALHATAVQRVEFDAAAKGKALENFFANVEEDLRFLSRMRAVRDLATAETRVAPDRVAALRREVEQELATFSQGKRAYYQLRYLNRAGHEVVRLNVEQGRPAIVPLHELQDKSARYYVQAAAATLPGDIYVSPVDLNFEHGQLETPPRRVVRYATAVTGAGDRERGLLVINVFADHLLSLLAPLPTGAEAWLVDDGNNTIGHLGRSDAAGESGESAGTPPREMPVAPPTQRDAPRTLTRADAFVCRAPVALAGAVSARGWTLLIAYPRAPLEAPIRHLSVFLWVLLAFVVAMAATIGVLLAHYLAQPVAALRRATREIADGDLARHVTIKTGDELEELANDFNAMTGRLRAAQERLATWNAELAREVAEQTEHVQRLERGLARADTLASIGQMTASVMHEIGNPLAAIKTKIQVAEEEGGLPREGQAVLDEVLREVDRLTAFLRSFSRLARLREPRMETVWPAEVVQGVVTLVSPELRRRSVALRVETATDLPPVRGDANQLRQLLINLILNAAEASPGGSEIAVRARCERAGADGAATVVLEIADHGAGIAPEVLDKIWEAFFTTKPEGTGLGLAICRRIVEDHGGDIQVRSRPGEGTTATIRLPCGEEPRMNTKRHE